MVFDNPLAVIFDDEAPADSEPREIVIGHSARNRLLLVCFVERDDGVRIIRRECDRAFADRASAGAPHAIHAADRWHLTPNLGAALQRVLDRPPAALRAAAQALPSGTSEPPPPTTRRWRRLSRFHSWRATPNQCHR